MDRMKIKQLMENLKLQKIKDSEHWVSSSCPAAKWKHEGGVDSHNSFGIKVGTHSWFNCFTCGFNGPLVSLPSVLSYFNSEDSYMELREFISKNEGWFVSTQDIPKSLLPMNEIILQKFYDFKPTNLITQEMIDVWNIRYDIIENRMLVPIYDCNLHLVGLRGRYLGKDPNALRWRVYKELNKESSDAKFSGVWLGMHFPLIPDAPIIVVEGDRDCILTSSHYPNVWGSMGATISKAQLETLKLYNHPIVLFMDNDCAGNGGAKQIYDAVKGLFPVYKVKSYFGCKDPAELYEKGLLTEALYSKELLA